MTEKVRILYAESLEVLENKINEKLLMYNSDSSKLFPLSFSARRFTPKVTLYYLNNNYVALLSLESD